jgi:hypothetical protein
MEPLATPNAAPALFAGGAGAGLFVAALPDCAPLDALAVLDADAPDVNDADGPIALFDTVLTAPLIVAKLLCTLATGPEMDEMDGVALELAALATAELIVMGNVTWMRISSHWAPIHSSYRL